MSLKKLKFWFVASSLMGLLLAAITVFGATDPSAVTKF
jgi:hypothetical protein